MVLNDAYFFCFEDFDEYEFLEVGEAFVLVIFCFVGFYVFYRFRDVLRFRRDVFVCFVIFRVCSYLKIELINYRDKIYRNLIFILKFLCLIVFENNRGVIEIRFAIKIGLFY